MPRLPIAGLLVLARVLRASGSPSYHPRSFEYVAPGLSSTSSARGYPNLQATVIPQAFADTYGAKCLDGTPPAFYSLIQDPTRWVIFIEGGGWCFSLQDCASRATGGGGSSRGYNGTSMNVGGLLSPDPAINPRFYNYSFVFIHYCDGSSHSSSAALPANVSGRLVWFRGRPNLDAQLGYLNAHVGLANAKEVILSGGSAGGTSVFLALDHVATLVPSGARFVGAPDAGFFVDAPLWNNATDFFFRSEFLAADVFWNSTGSGSLNAHCLAAFASEPWRCFFPENAGPLLATPWHAMMAAYDLASLDMILCLGCEPPGCAPPQYEAMQLWRFTFLGALAPAVESYVGNGAFIDSCLVHEQNVDYCSSQPKPNCKGWNIYNVTSTGFPPALTPDAGFALWYDATLDSWERLSAARAAWRERVVASLPHGPSAYPRRPAPRTAAAGGAEGALSLPRQIVVIDPLEWPGNPSCPWGT